MKKLIWVIVLLLNFNSYATDYFVSLQGNDNNDGLTEKSSWRTITYAASNAVNLKAGDIVWIKAGNYGSENVVFRMNGQKGKPISFIGYKNKPGDIDTFDFKYTEPKKGKEAPFNSSFMPLLSGKNRSEGKGFYLYQASNVTIKNIQIKNYNENLMGINCVNTTLENVITAYSGGILQNYGYGIFLSGLSNGSVVRNCISFDNGGDNILVRGNDCIIENNISVCGAGGNDKWLNTDYYIKWRGDNCIIRNNFVQRIGDLGHGGHGIGTKAGGSSSRYSLVENNTVINTSEGIFIAYDKASDNIIRKNFVRGNSPTDNRPNAYICRDGAYNNLFESNTSQYTSTAIALWRSKEEQQIPYTAKGNIFRNNLFMDTFRGITSTLNGNKVNDQVSGNIVENNTFIALNVGKESEFFRTNFLVKIHDNILRNNNIINFDEHFSGIAKSNQWLESNNNYFDCSFSLPAGANNISKNPDFQDAKKENYRLKSSSKLIDAGMNIKEVKEDLDGNSRPVGKSHDIGAFEFQGNSTGSVNADAGSDQDICLGSEVTLTASGGSGYTWNTGATTKSITVSPEDTTTYSVIVSEGSQTDSDQVTVTVVSLTADAGSDVSIELGESIELTASEGDSYLWSTGETTRSISVSPEETTAYKVTISKGECEASDTVNVQVNATNVSVVADAGSDQDICLGSELTLTASGGSGYTWNTGATTKSITVSPDQTTTYSVIVSEGSQTDSDQVTVTVVSLTADAGSDVSIELGESIELTASEGDSYLWSTGETTRSISVSPETTTDYEVTIQKGECEASDKVNVEVTVTESSVSADAGSDQEICLGSEVTLTASGGSSYTWSTGATTKSITVSPDQTTTYSVIVSEGSQTDSDQVEVTVNSLTADAGSDVNIELGESIELTASEGDSYLWSTGETTRSISVSPETTTDYEVTIQKGECEASDTVNVQVNATNVSVIADAGEDATICLGESLELKGKGGESYLWSTGEASKNITVTPERTTTYTLRVTQEDEGTVNSDTITITVENCEIVNTEDILNQEFIVFPNPTSGLLNINVNNNDENLDLILFSLQGSVLFKDQIDSSKRNYSKEMNLSRYTKGIYFVKLFNSNQNFVKKIILI